MLATTAFATAIMSTSRQLYGRVIIDYSNLETDSSIVISSNGVIDPNHEDQVVDSITPITYKWASLDGSWLLDDSYHLMPPTGDDTDQVGWWSNLPSLTADGTFPVNPILTVSCSTRSFDGIIVVGDDKRNEYAKRFEVKMYDSANNTVATHTITGNTSVMYTAAVTVALLVNRTTLEIIEWSHPGRSSKISEFYTGMQRTYEGDDILEIVTTEERDISNASLPIGNISSNEINISLSNVDGKFDIGNTDSTLYNQLKPNRRIRAWIGCKLADATIEYIPLGIYWSGDWHVKSSDIYVTVAGNDLMKKLSQTTYSTSQVVINTTLYDMAIAVLTDHGLVGSDYTVDTELQNFTIPYGWFDPVSHREALRKIVEACAGQAYVDRSGHVQVQGPAFLTAIATAPVMISENDYTDKENPQNWLKISNYVTATVKPLTVSSATETVYSSAEDISVSAGDTVTHTIFYNSKPCISASLTISASNTAVFTISSTFYAWGANISITNISATSTLKLFVNALKLIEGSTSTVVSQDAALILDYNRLTYSLPDNNFIQTTQLAQTLTDSILATFKDPRCDMAVNYRGNPAVELTDIVSVPDWIHDVGGVRTPVYQNYYVISQTLNFDGGLSATIAGRKVV